ncbi:MAG: ATP-grasp domain-containing protein [Bacteroidales bacterium]|nr:ATP-grasp domain-containing protein [Bacteroidales bacterium]
MILLDKPFVSDFFLDTIKKNGFSVVKTPNSSTWISDDDAVVISPEEAAQRRKVNREPVYTNSENSIGWIERNAGFSYLTEKIKLFKNKVAFRELLQEQYPGYFFRPVTLAELHQLDVSGFPFPFIIKPAVGFFSMGVYKVNRLEEWPETLKKMEAEIKRNRNLYPEEVYSESEFIVEEVIEGDEFAIDCYINDNKEAVILNIMKHIFSSGDDVGDRLYFTSAEIMQHYLEPATRFLENLAKLADLKQFPMHVELRFDASGNAMPIEVNPMRFGGWCSTPDFAWYAYGINVYEHYFHQQKPDWERILKMDDGKTHCIIVLDNSTGYPVEKIESFDYEKLMSTFQTVWDLRKVNHKEYPLFGMLFVASESEDSEEVSNIRHSDLKEFIITR